jgi:hypothetical protein
MLECDYFGADVPGNADNPLTFHRQRKAELMARERRTAHAQESARRGSACSGGFHHHDQGNAQLFPPGWLSRY